jgi:hypothetical protein
VKAKFELRVNGELVSELRTKDYLKAYMMYDDSIALLKAGRANGRVHLVMVDPIAGNDILANVSLSNGVVRENPLGELGD